MNHKHIYYYHLDHLGTPQEMTDSHGKVVWAASYRAFGNLAVHYEQQIENNLRFQGQYYDSESGLHYNRFRYYDPSCGRYLTQDPIGLAGGLNPYQYASDPLAFVDPLGLCQEAGSSWLDDFQTGLDVLGLAPGVGILADGLNALVSLGRGDLGGAALSLGAMVPILGQGVTVGKVAKNIAQRPIVIGENMKRVKEYAVKFGGHAYSPWRNHPFDFNLSMKRNERWIKDQIRSGREVIDIGPDFQRRVATGHSSPFYEMERRTLKGYENYNKYFERNSRSGGVSGLDF